MRLFGRDPLADGPRARRRRRVRRGADLLSVPERPAQPRAAGRVRRRRRAPTGSTRRSRPSSCPTGPRTASAATRTGCASGWGSPPRCCANPKLLLLDEPATGPRPRRHARHAAADPAAGRPGDDRDALEPPAGRGRGAVQPGGDRPHRARSSTRARSPTLKRGAGTTYRLSTTDDERALRGVPGPAGDRATSASSTGGSRSPPTRRRSPSCRRRWSRPAR